MTNIQEITRLVGETYLPIHAPADGGMNSTFSVVSPEGVFTETISGGDIYDIIWSDQAREMASKADYVAIVTHGWASPRNGSDDDEIAPSQHPERRRVSIACVASRDASVHSAMRMAGEEEIIYENSGVGALADALNELFF